MKPKDRPETAPAQEAPQQFLRRIDAATAPREPQRIGDVVARILSELGPRRARRRRAEAGGA